MIKCWLIVLALTLPVMAQDAMLDVISTKEDKAEEDVESKNINAERAIDHGYIMDEQNRIKEIRLLSLDVEKTALMVKQQELLTRINQLSQPIRDNAVISDVERSAPMSIHLRGVMILGNKAKAMVEYGHQQYVVGVGDKIQDFTVSDIKADTIAITDDLGKTIEISMNKS